MNKYCPKCQTIIFTFAIICVFCSSILLKDKHDDVPHRDFQNNPPPVIRTPSSTATASPGPIYFTNIESSSIKNDKS